MAAKRTLDGPAGAAVFDSIASTRILIAMALGFVVLVLAASLASRVALPGGSEEQVFAGAEVSPPRALPALTLQRADGTIWSSDETRGRISIFFFGYTHCPDVCPLTLSRANQIAQRLGADVDEVDVYFITVDPERDTPDRLGRYVSQFNPAFIALSGTAGQLEAARAAFGVIAVRQPGPGDSYAVDHTASSYLIDASGSIRFIYPHDAPAEDVVADIDRLLAERD